MNNLNEAFKTVWAALHMAREDSISPDDGGSSDHQWDEICHSMAIIDASIPEEKSETDGGRSWIVCWMEQDEEELTLDTSVDYWEVRESHAEAKALYNSLYHNDVVQVRSLCAVMDSSDYEPHEAFQVEVTA